MNLLLHCQTADVPEEPTGPSASTDVVEYEKAHNFKVGFIYGTEQNNCGMVDIILVQFSCFCKLKSYSLFLASEHVTLIYA